MFKDHELPIASIDILRVTQRFVGLRQLILSLNRILFVLFKDTLEFDLLNICENIYVNKGFFIHSRSVGAEEDVPHSWIIILTVLNDAFFWYRTWQSPSDIHLCIIKIQKIWFVLYQKKNVLHCVELLKSKALLTTFSWKTTFAL